MHLDCDIHNCADHNIEHEKGIHRGIGAVYFLVNNFSIHPQSWAEIAFLVTAKFRVMGRSY